MKRLIILAAAASLAGCHHGNNEAAGPAPMRGDTTVTHVIDTSRTGPPGTQGRPGGGQITVDSITTDSSARVNVDTARADSLRARRSIPQDTLGPRTPDSTSGRTGWTDTTAADTTSH
jgi:hypothetical protein